MVTIRSAGVEPLFPLVSLRKFSTLFSSPSRNPNFTWSDREEKNGRRMKKVD